jgi:hypothetical protein
MLAEAKRLHAAALDDLAQLDSNILPREYQHILDAVKQREQIEAEAQALLDEHVRRHQC